MKPLRTISSPLVANTTELAFECLIAGLSNRPDFNVPVPSMVSLPTATSAHPVRYRRETVLFASEGPNKVSEIRFDSLM
jgi:hypothetical protein